MATRINPQANLVLATERTPAGFRPSNQARLQQSRASNPSPTESGAWMPGMGECRAGNGVGDLGLGFSFGGVLRAPAISVQQSRAVAAVREEQARAVAIARAMAAAQEAKASADARRRAAAIQAIAKASRPASAGTIAQQLQLRHIKPTRTSLAGLGELAKGPLMIGAIAIVGIYFLTKYRPAHA